MWFAIFTDESTVLLLQKYVLKVCALSFVFWLWCLKVYIHLRWINTQLRKKHLLNHYRHCHGWVYYVDTTKYGFKVCVILFVFYSTHYKPYIHLHCINKQRLTTEPFGITHITLSSDCQTPKLYQGSANCCMVDWNPNIIHLLQPYKTIHYCNQLVLAIVPDPNIFIWSITNFDLISRTILVQLFFITC